MDSIFGFYYVIKLLSVVGWPRRRSLFNSEAVFDSTILDATIENMIDWAASLGALRPEISLKILSTTYRSSDWSSKDSYSLICSVNSLIDGWKKSVDNSPRTIVRPVKFAEHAKFVSMGQLKDKDCRNALEGYFIEALIWGLCNPDTFTVYFKDSNKIHESNILKYTAAKLNTDEMPTLDEFLKEGEDIIRSYEKEIRSLLPIADKLKVEANDMGIKF